MNAIDEIFFNLQGVEQFVVGNIALARHRRFFLNLADAEKLAILNERGHGLAEAKGVGKSVVSPSADDWKGLHRMLPQPRQAKDKNNKKTSAPVQMRLW